MNSSKDKLFYIAQETIKQVYKSCFFLLSPFHDKDICNQILATRLEEKKENFERIEEMISLEIFKQFLKAPQITDIHSNYLCYLLGINIMELEDKEKILADDINNYFMEIITNNYSELSNDHAILVIKEYFRVLAFICSKKFQVEIYSNFIGMENRIIVKHYIFENKKKFISRKIQKVKAGIREEFIPTNITFKKIKEQYTKALKQIYQMGFIYLIGEYKFNEFYIPPIFNIDGNSNMPWRREYSMDIQQYKKARERWKNIFDSRDITYIVGGAGYGKSLFLRNIINNYSKLQIENCKDHLLIYCDLKSYYSNGNSNKKTMIDFFQESMINITGIEGIIKEFIRYYLNIGRCIFLLDALDEVPKEFRADLHKKLVGFFSTCNLNNKVCITSRGRGFIPKQDIEVLEILPLIDKDIEAYIEKLILLKTFKKEDKETFMKQAQVLIEKNFLNNFLVLSLLVKIYKSERELPENKIELYKKCFEYIAKKREEEKSKTGYNWDNIYPLMKDSTFISLSVLAAPNNKDVTREKVEELLIKQYKTKYPDEAKTDIAIKEFLEFCSNRTELFVPSSVDDKFKFFHRSFFEYFYSRYIHQRSEIEEMYTLMSVFDIDSEIFELTVALVKEDNEKKYQCLVEYIFEKIDEEFAQENLNCTAFCIMTLAMQVIDDAYFIQKYFEDVIKYCKYITKGKIFNMNQKLLYMWIEKGIGQDKNKQEKFKETYEMECVFYILTLMSSMNTVYNMGKKLISFEHTVSINLNSNIEFQIGTRNVPFYLSVYNKYYSILELIDGYNKANLHKLINSLPVSKKEKNTLKKGYGNYMKLEPEHRKLILEGFSIM